MRFLIQTNECVNTVRIHFPWCIMFIIYILRFKFLFNDKFVAQIQVKSSQKDVSYINVLTTHFLVNSNCLSLTIPTKG